MSWQTSHAQLPHSTPVDAIKMELARRTRDSPGQNTADWGANDSLLKRRGSRAGRRTLPPPMFWILPKRWSAVNGFTNAVGGKRSRAGSRKKRGYKASCWQSLFCICSEQGGHLNQVFFFFFFVYDLIIPYYFPRLWLRRSGGLGQQEVDVPRPSNLMTDNILTHRKSPSAAVSLFLRFLQIRSDDLIYISISPRPSLLIGCTVGASGGPKPAAPSFSLSICVSSAMVCLCYSFALHRTFCSLCGGIVKEKKGGRGSGWR